MTGDEKALWRRYVAQSVIAAVCVIAIGVGCWWLNPAYGLIIPAMILLSGIIYERTRKA